MTTNVPFVALNRQYEAMKDDIDNAIFEVLRSGNYVLGREVELFEAELAKICGVKHALTVANGTDALVMALKVLGVRPNDEVIVPTNSFIASAGAVVQVGAKPVFCDVRHDHNIDPNDALKKITAKTKAIMPVHLTGKPADMVSICSLANEHNLFVVEDAAQAIGASIDNQTVGSMGDIGAFSLHPLKNLFVFGDGGFITVNCPWLYEKLVKMRNHGLADRNTCSFWGQNSRLDTLHCAVGLAKIQHFDKITERFIQIADQYTAGLSDIVTVPENVAGVVSVFHNYVIVVEERDRLMKFLIEHGVETKIHYPTLLHRQPAAAGFGGLDDAFPVADFLNSRQLSLPIFPEITQAEIQYVIQCIRSFFGNQ